MDFMTDPAPNQPNDSNRSLLTNIVGFSFLASLIQGFLTGRPATGGNPDTSYLAQTVQLFFLGTLIESGRRFYEWLVHRFQFQYSITAQFTEGDPTYEWIIHFLTEHHVWKCSRDFRVSATNSARKWNVSIRNSRNDPTIPLSSISTSETNTKSSDPSASSRNSASAEYVPTYEAPQLFRWNGYWVEIKRTKGMSTLQTGSGTQAVATLYITIYTRNMSILSTLIDTAKSLYLSSSRPHVTVHSSTRNTRRRFSWNNTKRKARRPLDSIILPEGTMQELINDAREFMNLESWYVKVRIPHRRGYLLYGPPGTGKTSTIYGLAGELGLEIYTISLASSMVDDSFLQRAADSIPKHSIFLIEDIDCAFPAPRSEDDDDTSAQPQIMMGHPTMGRRSGHGMMSSMGRSAVTLSGLLNVLDGVGSEEGKLFFATTNHIDHLDAALLRPGRIDVKIPYKLATQDQAAALFMRFYPEMHTEISEEALAEFAEKIHASDHEKPPAYGSSEKAESTPALAQAGEERASLKSQYLTYLSNLFASQIPGDEFSTAELQGFLLGCKSQSQSQSLSTFSLSCSQFTPSTSPSSPPTHSITPLTHPSHPLLTLLKSPIWVHSERTYKLEKQRVKRPKRRNED